MSTEIPAFGEVPTDIVPPNDSTLLVMLGIPWPTRFPGEAVNPLPLSQYQTASLPSLRPMFRLTFVASACFSVLLISSVIQR